MHFHLFISYSSVDAPQFAIKLHDRLEVGPPAHKVWLDKYDMKPSPAGDWRIQIDEALKECEILLFVITSDSVDSKSVCLQELSRALTYKKVVVPLLLDKEVIVPFGLEGRQYIDFTHDFDSSLSKLRNHLRWLKSPEGILSTLRDRLADAKHDLRRAGDDSFQKARIGDEIVELEERITDQEEIVKDPQSAIERVEKEINSALKDGRKTIHRDIISSIHTKIIYSPPGIAPSHYQNRVVETGLLGDFLKDNACRMAIVVGPGGSGKTAMVCRLLKSLERGQLPDGGGEMNVDGIIYLSAIGSHTISLYNLYTGFRSFVSENVAAQLDILYKDPQKKIEDKVQAFVIALSGQQIVVMLDNFETVLEIKSRKLNDSLLSDALRTLLNIPQHHIKIIITSRITPKDLVLAEPGKQLILQFDEGLQSPHAENVLREMDRDGKLGLRYAPESILTQARERTRGLPRALEALVANLYADRNTSLSDILALTEEQMPEQIVNILVGEAFNRLDTPSQKVMQALAVYSHPVTAAAIDYLLEPYLLGISSKSILNWLVNLYLVRKEYGDRYYLHPVDRAYAFSRIPKGTLLDRKEKNTSLFTQFALLHRGADYFRLARKPETTWQTREDLEPQEAEFDLRIRGGDYDGAAEVLLSGEVSSCFYIWGYYTDLIKMCERLLGHIDDSQLRMQYLSDLAEANYAVGHHDLAIKRYEEALKLSHILNDKSKEAECLSGLGFTYSEIGQSDRALHYFEKALPLARQIENFEWEAWCLNGIGLVYVNKQKYEDASNYYRQGQDVAHNISGRVGREIEATLIGNLAEALLYAGNFLESIQKAQQSIELAEAIGGMSGYYYYYLALAHLLSNNPDLPAAREAAEEARKYDEPLISHEVLAVLGVIAYKQDDRLAAQEAFCAAETKANERLSFATVEEFSPLHTKGLALIGLVLLGDTGRLVDAEAAYKAARKISGEQGIVDQSLRLFDILAGTNTFLQEIRRVVENRI